MLVAIARWGGALALGLAVNLLVRFAPAEPRTERWASAGSALVVAAWVVASLVFRWYATSVANFRAAAGQLAVFLILTGYLYTSSIIFLVGVQLDELLRRDATSGERGVLDVVTDAFRGRAGGGRRTGR